MHEDDGDAVLGPGLDEVDAKALGRDVARPNAFEQVLAQATATPVASAGASACFGAICCRVLRPIA